MYVQFLLMKYVPISGTVTKNHAFMLVLGSLSPLLPSLEHTNLSCFLHKLTNLIQIFSTPMCELQTATHSVNEQRARNICTTISAQFLVVPEQFSIHNTILDGNKSTYSKYYYSTSCEILAHRLHDRQIKGKLPQLSEPMSSSGPRLKF
jgi:hypothetical protein